MVVEKRVLGNTAAANIIRELDWSRTALGPIHSWSDSLLSSVNMILVAPIPMQLFWGPEYICIYNDAIVPAFSTKHPASMGQPASEVWAEAWDTVGPQMVHVYERGEAVSFGNALVPLFREGVLEDRYWTYSYSPVFDGNGMVVGVLDVA